MSTVKQYYKVVTTNLTSAMAAHKYIPPEFVVQYIKGQFVEPRVPKTKLMVFTDLQAAKDFANNWLPNMFYGHQIWQVEVKNPQKTGIYIYGLQWLIDHIDFKSKINYLLKRKNQHKKYINYNPSDIPPGSMFVDAVKLVERLV